MRGEGANDPVVTERFSGMVDARQRVTGDVGYTIDLTLPAMLHAKVLRSTSAHARIKRIDVSRARQVPGVVAVLTGADLVNRGDLQPYFGPVYRDQPILAIDKVRFVGDPVAAVAAVDLDAAREAVDLIEVEYEELPAVFTIDEALAEGASLVHEGPPRTGETFADVIVKPTAGTNICNSFRLRKGDIEVGFAESDEVFEDVFTSPPVQHVPMETHACIADVSGGRVTVWSSTQIPFVIRTQLAEIFRLPQSKVRVIIPTLGGGYGAKCYPKIEPLTAALSLVTRRPVRFHLTREEEFLTITKHGVRIRLKTGLKKDGTIVARQSLCHFNTGAYADIGPRLIKNGGYGTGGPHRIPHVAVDSHAVYTNIVPAGAFRGYGISQAAWAYETQMDMIAERMGIDPLELRMKNLLDDGDTVMTGEPMEDAHFKELLADATSYIGWTPEDHEPVRDGSKVRAKGFSCIIKGTVTPSTSTAAAKLNEDGSLDILTSSVEMGQGLLTALAILGGEPLGIGVDRVNVSTPDTDVTPYDQQSSSSRSTYAMGTAVQRAVREIRRKLFEHASELLEVSVDDLEIADGAVVVKGVPERALDFGAIVRKTRSGNIVGEATYRTEGGLDPETGQGIGSVHWHQAAAAAEVEVDTETGKVTLLRYHGGVYAGRIINPVQAELQTEGNLAFGIGQALYEEMLFDNGQLQNGNLGDYMIPSFEDLPREVDINVLEYLPADEIHGIGETSLPPVMPAIGNAVARATGVRIVDLPITPEKILRGLRELDARRATAEEVPIR
ncbi:MAG TPA: xanthine dehydrogenase family protein molybdopterin-binding subunit [Candidatus Limnocylindria bacterium]|nr:xanthine dehydrogenase family protein molybdopterin-binding subunit [Candidatus Limnocylindria bacterium]